MNMHAFNASSFSSLLVRVGKNVVVSNTTDFNPVNVEDLDAIRTVFAPWALTRPEAAVIAAVWAKEIAHENTYINEREFTSKEILNDVFGTEDTFTYLPVIRRLEALCFIAPTESVYKQCSLEDRRKPMRGQIQLYLQYAVTVGFHMMMEAIRDGHADEDFFANSQSVRDAVRNLVYDAHGRVVRISETTAVPQRVRKTYGRGMDNELLTVVDLDVDCGGYVLNADTQRQIDDVVTHVRGNRHDLLAEWGAYTDTP